MSTSSAVAGAPPRRRSNTGLDRFRGLYLWAVFIAVFGVWTPHEFLTLNTAHTVGSEQAVTGMVALAVLVPLAAGLYDLSVGATANLTGILAVVLMNNSHFGFVLPPVVPVRARPHLSPLPALPLTPLPVS